MTEATGQGLDGQVDFDGLSEIEQYRFVYGLAREHEIAYTLDGRIEGVHYNEILGVFDDVFSYRPLKPSRLLQIVQKEIERRAKAPKTVVKKRSPYTMCLPLNDHSSVPYREKPLTSRVDDAFFFGFSEGALAYLLR